MSRLFCYGMLALAVFSTGTFAQDTVQVNMNNGALWNTVQDDDTSVDFGFDYSIYGIPNAPGSDDSKGIRLAANIDAGAAAAISVSPKDLSYGGNYEVSVAVWMNYYADPGRVGTTEYGGLFIGHDPNGDVINGAGLIADGDGDSSRDYRLFKDSAEQFIESGQYDILSQNNNDIDLVEAFLGMEVPVEQLDDDVFEVPNEDVIAPDGTLGFGWHIFTADVDADTGTANFAIDDLSIGTIDTAIGDDVALEGSVALTMWDIFSSVAPVPEFAFAVFDSLTITGEPSGGEPGDFDGDGLLTANDINLLTLQIKAGDYRPQFDVNQDGDLDTSDHTFWVKDLKRTWFGDSNLDGEFSSTDFVSAFQAGKYEVEGANNAGWEEGDWNGDLQFDSSDFVTAFIDGGFEQGPVAAVAAVPEPSSILLLASAVIGFWSIGRRRR